MADLIDRQAAILAVEAALYCLSDDTAAACDAIKRVPSAQPERKTGRWVLDRLVTTSGGTYGVRRCSECEAYYQDIGYGWNYCPNCGARMSDGE